ncbi:hypothetical protein N7499_005120 [Penicillium canescens]|uniref:Uncharacterized protein n=1 Tax=Penicillium canescens TaxID=5083 RepID=A0AAD6I2J0_PENCN|nr:uncharacterized protein N7446_004382 [Penicillium canescens]KAJ6009482.1 hypothetical protein N7522_004498 [Penicillium canescens]KAJ6027015.1 hypothetical protein N7460_011832 [Penicillium canescens]KAJ6040301.1 hypothetical protein N7444_009206 [Penicillium canescens]KAJ6067345.1 hypothetical protein N7446_004382 [Penicillium canescens]KAJ6085491.1 hypothetical protein N7499_005120 [Penicillium canescens]
MIQVLVFFVWANEYRTPADQAARDHFRNALGPIVEEYDLVWSIHHATLRVHTFIRWANASLECTE